MCFHDFCLKVFSCCFVFVFLKVCFMFLLFFFEVFFFFNRFIYFHVLFMSLTLFFHVFVRYYYKTGYKQDDATSFKMPYSD